LGSQWSRRTAGPTWNKRGVLRGRKNGKGPGDIIEIKISRMGERIRGRGGKTRLRDQAQPRKGLVPGKALEKGAAKKRRGWGDVFVRVASGLGLWGAKGVGRMQRLTRETRVGQGTGACRVQMLSGAAFCF
jgi:hypothetical protein